MTAPDMFAWLPPEATGRRTDLGGEQILPKITITKTPKPTADASKYNREYVIELDKFHISNTGTNPVETPAMVRHMDRRRPFAFDQVTVLRTR